MITKICSKCGEEKSLDEFHKRIVRGVSKGTSRCRKCTNKGTRKGKYGDADMEIVRKAIEEDGLSCREAGYLIGAEKATVNGWKNKNNWKLLTWRGHPMKIIERNVELFNEGRRICLGCSEEKYLDEYTNHRDPRRPDPHGKNSRCRACTSAKSRVNHRKHRKKYSETHKRYLSNNKEKIRESNNRWDRNNRDKTRAYKKKMYQKNPELFLRAKRKRERILKEKQTPAYADKKARGIIYREMSRINREKGYTAVNVDHIIPLNGELVSGLHIETNLRIIKAEENAAKRHLFTPCSDAELPPNELEISPHLFPKQLERIYA